MNIIIIIASPKVDVVASASNVALGGSTTLLCNVTKTNPGIVGTYIWIKENTGTRLAEQSDNLLLNFSTVTDFGTYSCMVTNIAGEVGRGNITIKQRCKFVTLVQCNISLNMHMVATIAAE
jgi:hypothetical protein